MLTPAWFELESAFGRWRGVVSPGGLARLTLADRAAPAPPDAARDDSHPAAVEIREYLEGRRRAFTVPVDLSAVAPFRRRVLQTLRDRVPFGTTTTYAGLARLAGSAGAARAVGSAMATNPVPLVIPCHRVVAAGGRVGGFGFGLDAKRALLRLEGVALG